MFAPASAMSSAAFWSVFGVVGVLVLGSGFGFGVVSFDSSSSSPGSSSSSCMASIVVLVVGCGVVWGIAFVSGLVVVGVFEVVLGSGSAWALSCWLAHRVLVFWVVFSSIYWGCSGSGVTN